MISEMVVHKGFPSSSFFSGEVHFLNERQIGFWKTNQARVFCTKNIGEEGGFDVIKNALLNLSLHHQVHISAYEEGNERRLTGKHTTADINTYSLSQFRHISPHLLSSGDDTNTSSIIGDVYIHPSTKEHPTDALIGHGARLVHCIILDDVDIKENGIVEKLLLGNGPEPRLEGDPNAKLGVTIHGEAVVVEDEVVVLNNIVLPNKTLNIIVQGQFEDSQKMDCTCCSDLAMLVGVSLEY